MHRYFENHVSAKIISTLENELLGCSDSGNKLSDRTGPYFERLREILLGSASSYAGAVKSLISLSKSDRRRSKSEIEQIFRYSPMLSTVCAAELADITLVVCRDKLPTERYNSNGAPDPFLSRPRLDRDEIGIKTFGTPFYPPTPLSEPFHSLLNNSLSCGLELVQKLSDRAMEGWIQSSYLSGGDQGTPLPLVLEFPWGKQDFWGGKSVYLWSRGVLAPEPINSAYLALSYWAHKKLDGGDKPDKLIRKVLKGNKSVAAVGVAVSIILQTKHVSDVTLPIISNFRIWDMDINRQAQELGHGINFMGIDPLHGASDTERAAVTYLNERNHSTETLQRLAPHFLFNSQGSHHKRFKESFAGYKQHLPIYYREERCNSRHVGALENLCAEWAQMADTANYQLISEADDQGTAEIAYVPPKSLTTEGKEQRDEAIQRLDEYQAFLWAQNVLDGQEPSQNLSLTAAIDFAKKRVREDSFKFIKPIGDGVHQPMLAAIATVAQRKSDSKDIYEWAWGLLDRIDEMSKNAQGDPQGGHFMDPRCYLIVALGDRLVKSRDPAIAERLLRFTRIKVNDLEVLAFVKLFNVAVSYPAAAWAAGILASKLASLPGIGRTHFDENAAHEKETAATAALLMSLQNLHGDSFGEFADVPPAWVLATDAEKLTTSARAMAPWQWPENQFDWGISERVFKHFPVEVWMKNDTLAPIVTRYFQQLVGWVKDSIDPPWTDDQKYHTRVSHEFMLFFGSLISRLAQFFPVDQWYTEFVEPFLIEDNNSSEIILETAIGQYCARHIHDNRELPTDAVIVHRRFVDWICKLRSLTESRWRDGQAIGHYSSSMIKDVLLIAVTDAPNSARFSNGQWEDVHMFSQNISKLMSVGGWSPFVMGQYLEMCERAGVSQPLDAFCDDILSAVNIVLDRPELWSGTFLTAKISSRVQHYARILHPLSIDDRTRLLQVLDSMIDLGDRRAVALEQSEVFRSLQRFESESQ